METGNNGQTGGTSRPTEGQPIPSTTYVDSNSPVLYVGAGLLVVVAIVVAFFMVRRKLSKD